MNTALPASVGSGVVADWARAVHGADWAAATVAAAINAAIDDGSLEPEGARTAREALGGADAVLGVLPRAPEVLPAEVEERIAAGEEGRRRQGEILALDAVRQLGRARQIAEQNRHLTTLRAAIRSAASTNSFTALAFAPGALNTEL